MDTSFNVIDCYGQKNYGGCSPTKPINSYPLIPHNQRSGLSGGKIVVPINHWKCAAGLISRRFTKFCFRNDFWTDRSDPHSPGSRSGLILLLPKKHHKIPWIRKHLKRACNICHTKVDVTYRFLCIVTSHNWYFIAISHPLINYSSNANFIQLLYCQFYPYSNQLLTF
jgi:hypothetical protein